MNEGILYGVAGIDVVVNSDRITDAITRRFVDANVASVPLSCQLSQVEDHSLTFLVPLPGSPEIDYDVD